MRAAELEAREGGARRRVRFGLEGSKSEVESMITGAGDILTSFNKWKNENQERIETQSMKEKGNPELMVCKDLETQNKCRKLCCGFVRLE